VTARLLTRKKVMTSTWSECVYTDSLNGPKRTPPVQQERLSGETSPHTHVISSIKTSLDHLLTCRMLQDAIMERLTSIETTLHSFADKLERSA
jgi:hypothetical protein